MGIPDPGRLSLGEWIVIADGWKRAHGKGTVTPPSEDEFDAAVERVRGA